MAAVVPIGRAGGRGGGLTGKAEVETGREWPVLIFAGLVCVLLALSAFGADRLGYVDELGLYNPSYMLAHYGNLTYPAYGIFDQIIMAHPPLHVGVIGLFARLGFTWYYAEAAPAFLWFLLGIVLIVRAPFPATMKLGLLFSIAFVLRLSGPEGGFGFNTFGTRPEGHVEAAWLTGLILLETGRLEGWRKGKLFAGALAVAWASGVHYYAVPAGLAVAVYAIAAVWQLGWRKAVPPLAAMAGGACLFGIPYAAFFLWPNRQTLAEVLRLNQGTSGVSAAIGLHLSIYRTWAAFMHPWLKWALNLGFPVLLLSAAILLWLRPTRMLACAALPLPVFIFFFATHKQGGYLMHELALFGAALATGALALAGVLVSRIPNAGVRRAFLPVSAGVLCLSMAIGSPTVRAAKISLKPHVHEADVARAAARELLGPDAAVASKIALWYASGGASWYGLPDNWPIRRPAGAIRFLECFDAVAAGEFGSAFTGDVRQEALSFQYAEGALKLRGFYFGHSDPELQFVLLHPHPAVPLAGYAARGDRLFRFDEQAGGSHEVITAVCPDLPATRVGDWRSRWPSAFSAVLYLPQPRPDGANNIVTVLAARDDAEPAGQIGRACRVMARVPGALREVDKYALVGELRRSDVPIQFYRGEWDVPGCLAHLNSDSR